MGDCAKEDNKRSVCTGDIWHRRLCQRRQLAKIVKHVMCKLICVRGKAGDSHCMKVFLRVPPKGQPHVVRHYVKVTQGGRGPLNSNPTTQHEFAADIVHRTRSGRLQVVPLASTL